MKEKTNIKEGSFRALWNSFFGSSQYNENNEFIKYEKLQEQITNDVLGRIQTKPKKANRKYNPETKNNQIEERSTKRIEKEHGERI